MTKIKMLNDRIIFDGHAHTRQECEIITLMANLLDSCGSGFNTVEYRAGYAEFVKSDCIKLRNDELKFVPAIGTVTVVFDSHITKVENTYGSVTTSGDTLTTSDAVNPETFIVTLEDGYVIDTVVLDNADAEAYGSLGSIGETSFTAYPGYGGIDGTITITSKIPAAKQTIDVSTLTGWANLSTGNHQITIKTKASGYADSAKSNAVSVTKAASGYTVTFDDQEMGGATGTAYYSLDNGATWTQFCEIISDASNYLSPTSLTNITSIKFKIEVNDLGAPPFGVKLVCSAINLSLGGKNTGTFTSDNYTLTEDITIIITT